jgi:potassium/hydrogen antiporter
VIRPVLVGLCLIPARLKSNERTFVLFAGLKGAVPILLASFLLAAHVPVAQRLYGIVIVVVVFSVVVQGSLVPTAARLLHVQMRDGQLVPITSDTIPRPGDDILVLADPSLHEQLITAFEGPPAE